MADEISPVVLIVEDNALYAEGLKTVIERAIPGVTILTQRRNFENALDEIPSCRPDVFIVDLYEDEYAPETRKGPDLCKKIWDRRFRPIIVHSAFPADPHIDELIARHPFYKYIGKGKEGADEVAAQVKEFLIHAAALRDVEDEVHAVLQTVLQDTAGTIWDAESDPTIRTRALIRSARRRVGAMMDLKPLRSGETVLPWEQYIVPPLESDLLMADMLFAEDGDREDASCYRVVLTPSCDLVLHGGKPKVKQVLLGKCVNAKTFFGGANLNPSNEASDLKKQLMTILTQPQINGYCPLPAYPGLWPDMAIKLRETELLNFDVVSTESKKAQFKRVASIDSPFREQMAWAHMLIASRPALPDRDVGLWADSLIAAAQKKVIA